MLKLISHLFLLFFYLTSISINADLNSERSALLALRSAVGGRALLWNSSEPTPCNWIGVICSSDKSQVTELHLPGTGLSGIIPLQIFSNLTSLNTLSLRYNALLSPLPSDLSMIKDLRNLYLQYNLFSGPVPDSIFSLTSLVRLNLGNNNFSGSLSSAFNNLTRLGTLYLQSNSLSGSVPDLNIPSLEQFDVSDNNLTGRIPNTLSGKSKSAFSGNSLCGKPLDLCPGETESKSKRLSGGAIAGIIIGCVIAFLLILLIIFLLCRKRGKKEVGSAENGVIQAKQTDRDFEMSEIPESDIELAVTAKEKNKAIEQINLDTEKKKLIFLNKSTDWNFDLEDLLRASAEVLGKGTFGTAYKAVLGMGTTVAVKRLKDLYVTENEFRLKMEEIGRMNDENLVPLRAYYFNRDEKLLVYEYMPMGSLSALLHGNRGSGRTPLNWETRASIALRVAKGINYIHTHGPTYSHGNIKSSNILLTNGNEARVSDLGLAQIVVPGTTPTRVGGYRAPEVTDTRKVSQKGDVYSFGVLLLELLTGKAPTNSVSNEEGVDLPRWVQSVVREEWTNEVFDLELLRYQSVEEDMVSLLQLAIDCTAQYPDKRPDMVDVSKRIEEICNSESDETLL